MFNNINQLSGL